MNLFFTLVDFNNNNLMNFRLKSLIEKLITCGVSSFIKLRIFSLYFSSTITQKMVGLPGFEPGTSPLSGVHSNQLSYRPENNL